MFNFLYMLILSKLLDIHVYLWVFAFHAKSLYRLNCVWICMYAFSFDKIYICLGVIIFLIKKLNFDDFHVFEKEFHNELYCLFPWFYDCMILTLTLFDVFSWLCFHEYDMYFIDFECWWSCDLHVFHEIYFALFLTWRISY